MGVNETGFGRSIVAEVDWYIERLLEKKERKVHDRNEMEGFVRGTAWGVALVMNPYL